MQYIRLCYSHAITALTQHISLLWHESRSKRVAAVEMAPCKFIRGTAVSLTLRSGPISTPFIHRFGHCNVALAEPEFWQPFSPSDPTYHERTTMVRRIMMSTDGGEVIPFGDFDVWIHQDCR
jgi:hypothetical protein